MFLIRRLLATSGDRLLTLAGLWSRCRSSEVSTVAAVLPLILVAAGGAAYVLFAWSSAHIDTAVTSSVFQLWVCVWFFSMRRIDVRRVGPHLPQAVPARVYAFGVAALGGSVLAVLSAGGESPAGGSVLLGAVLAMLATATACLPVAQFLAVDRILYGSGSKSDTWRDTVLGRFTPLEVEESISVSMWAVARLAALAGAVLLAVLEASPTTFVSWSFAGGFAAGALIHGPGGVSDATVAVRVRPSRAPRDPISRTGVGCAVAVVVARVRSSLPGAAGGRGHCRDRVEPVDAHSASTGAPWRLFSTGHNCAAEAVTAGTGTVDLQRASTT